MYLDILPTETITQIFLYLPTISSAVALSSTCHRFRQIYSSSKKLPILSRAAEREYGPLSEAVQLVTHNSSQPAHVHRDVPLSFALLQSIVKVGAVAAKWADVYPFKKWNTDYENRRLLTSHERFVVRRAVYRLWLFSRAFHTRDHPRTARATPQAMYERAALLHNFSTHDLAEMYDAHEVLRDTIAHNICPSNGTIRREFGRRFPESNYQLLFNMGAPNSRNNPPPLSSSSFLSHSAPADLNYHASTHTSALSGSHKFTPSRTHEPGLEGWGDEILHYYVVEDMLKLDPGQILWLYERAPMKAHVEMFVWGLGGDWFENNGETFTQTLAFVVQQRGGEMEEIKEMVGEGEMGVALVGDGREGEGEGEDEMDGWVESV